MKEPLHESQPSPDGSPLKCIYPSSREQATAWSLVLTALNIPHEFAVEHGAALLTVDPAFFPRTVAEINAYEEENHNWPPSPAVHPEKSRAEITVWILLAITAAMGMTFTPEFQDAGQAGAAWADKIIHGEWWRAATALTLHADPAHLMGNMFIGGFIMVQACTYMGSGLAWFLTVCSGCTGNLLNALLQPPSHVSVGSSTAVFGLVGMLTAFRAVHNGPGRPKDFILPLGAGIAILGFTGTAGAHTDLGAHICGFISGVTAGLAAGAVVRINGFPSRRTGRLLAAVSIAIPLSAWSAAYLTSP